MTSQPCPTAAQNAWRSARRAALAFALTSLTACAWLAPAGPTLVDLPPPMQGLRLPLANASLEAEAGGVSFSIEAEGATAAKVHARLSAALVDQGWEPLSRERIPRGLTSRWAHHTHPDTLGLLVGGGRGKVSGLITYSQTPDRGSP